MIIKTKEFQQTCKSILGAVDTTTNATGSETLELIAEGKKLTLNVTNGEYFVSICSESVDSDDFKATVDAKLFLNLIDKLDTEQLELKVKDNSLLVKANGNYIIPMIFLDDKLLELKSITIDNVTNSFGIAAENLLSMLSYNTKEFSIDVPTKASHMLYYLDEQGCITYRQGACVNNFYLENPVKLVLNQKLVKLFKLFSKDGEVKFTLGQDDDGGVIQTKVRFETSTTSITAITLNDASLLASFPIKAIRGRADNTYKYTINLDRNLLIRVLERLSLFTPGTYGLAKDCASFKFFKDNLIISTLDEKNVETVPYNNTEIDGEYSCLLNIVNLKLILEGCTDQYITLHFGDGQAFVIARGNTKTVIPECRRG